MRDINSAQSLAARIRGFVYERYVVPARAAGHDEVVVRTGDVHREMGLVSRIPAVCSALGATFEKDYRVALQSRSGPAIGANVFLRFRTAEAASGQGHATKVSATEFQQNVGRYQDAALHGPVVITKHDRPYTVLLSAHLFEAVMRRRGVRESEEALTPVDHAVMPGTQAELERFMKDWVP
jgi:PHD/YefM family antitoxin component YafN of YafNO toxin-antitoxin module